MIIHNNSTNQGALPVRLVSDDAPRVVVPKGASSIPGQTAPQQPSSQQLNSAVESINKAMRQSNRSLELSVDENTKKPIVRMVDTTTGSLIRQFPSEEVLAIAHSIDQFLQQQHGLLLKEQA